MKLKGWMAISAVLAAAGGAGVALSRAADAVLPGAEVFSVLEEEVMSLTYRSPSAVVAATRHGPGDRFEVRIAFADGRRPKQCDTSPDLAGLLHGLSSLTAMRAVPASRLEARYPRPLGTLSVGDRIASESPVTITFRATAGLTEVAATLEQRHFEVNTPAKALVQLEQLCEGRAPPGPSSP